MTPASPLNHDHPGWRGAWSIPEQKAISSVWCAPIGPDVAVSSGTNSVSGIQFAGENPAGDGRLAATTDEEFFQMDNL
jgi:hypothetical protein